MQQRVIRIAAAVIEQHGTILLARRSAGLAHAQCWEFPGGKIEPGESPEACLARELREELDIEVTIGTLIGISRVSMASGVLELMAYHAWQPRGSFRLTDHDAIAWVAPADLLSYQLSPADVPIARVLAGEP